MRYGNGRQRCFAGEAFNWLLEHLEFNGNECLVWPFGKTQGGYGTVRVDGKTHLAHRVACERRHGPPPTLRHQAAHFCGNRGCVNVHHLRWATNKENADDRTIHGTDIQGEKNKNAKLSAGDIVKIREATKPIKVVAKEFGISRSHAAAVMRGAAWSWLEA